MIIIIIIIIYPSLSSLPTVIPTYMKTCLVLSDTLSFKAPPLKAIALLFLVWKSEKSCHEFLK